LSLVTSILLDTTIYSIVAIGILILFIWGKRADLTPDASFVSGALGAWWISGVIPSFFVSTLAGLLFGMIAGLVTFFITRTRIPTLLASLITIGIAYSIHWAAMGKPLQTRSISNTLGLDSGGLIMLCLFFIVLTFVVVTCYFFSKSWIGIKAIAAAQNPNSLPNGSSWETCSSLISLVIGNAFVGLAGGLFYMRSGIVEVNMGVGITISGLACVLIGWAVFKFQRHSFFMLLGAVIGALIMRGVLGISLQLGLPAMWFKFLSALVLLAFLLIVGRSTKNVLSDIKL